MSFLYPSEILLPQYAVYYLLLKLKIHTLERPFVLQKVRYTVLSVSIKEF